MKKNSLETKIKNQYAVSLVVLISAILIVGHIAKTGSCPIIGSLYEKDLQQYRIEHNLTE